MISTETGARMRTCSLNGTAISFVNTQTDRLFLTNPQGLVVCIHEDKHEFPHLHVDVGEATSEDADAPVKKNDPAAKPKVDEADPFGGF
jgi:hypothetical protein